LLPFGTYKGHLQIILLFGAIFCGYLGCVFRFGMLWQEKSGNSDADVW
jgi:hypothetical protein